MLNSLKNYVIKFLRLKLGFNIQYNLIIKNLFYVFKHTLK